MTFNTRSPAVKRLMREAEELSVPTELFYAQPLEDNIFEWHFTIRGPADTDFDGGIYHGRILLPHEYPMKPPSIILLTNNGRFKVNEKICLSISGHHPETWLPSWSIRTALLALIGFMPTMGEGAIGSLDYTTEERKFLAKKSISYSCSVCKIDNATVLPCLTDKSQDISAEAKNLASQIEFKNKNSEQSIQAASSSITTSSIQAATTLSSSSITNQLDTPQVVHSISTNQENQSTTSVSSISTSNNSINRNSLRTENEMETSRSSNSNGGFFYLSISILSAIFLFLFFRRVYLLMDIPFPI